MSPSPSCGWNAGSVLHVTYSNLSGPNQSLKCSKWRKALISLALSETYWWIPESGLSLNLLTRYGKAFSTGYSVGSVVPSSTESQRGGRVCLSVCVSHMCLSVDICVCGGRRTISEDNWVPGPHRPLYLSPCLSTASLLYTASELPIILLTPPPISQARDTLGQRALYPLALFYPQPGTNFLFLCLFRDEILPRLVSSQTSEFKPPLHLSVLQWGL